MMVAVALDRILHMNTLIKDFDPDIEIEGIELPMKSRVNLK
jgi:hypothetical protein